MSTGSDLWCPSPPTPTPFWAKEDVFKTFSMDSYKETLIIIGYPKKNSDGLFVCEAVYIYYHFREFSMIINRHLLH